LEEYATSLKLLTNLDLIVKKTALLLLMCASGIVQAEPRYITDQTHITMRAGEGPTEQMLRMIPAGEKVDLISSNRQTGYSKIRDRKDHIGFVLTSQLMKNPGAREKLADVEKRYKILKQEMKKSSKPYKELQEKYKQLEAEHEKLKSSKESLDSELQERTRSSDEMARISEERKDLRKKLASQTWEMENLKQEYQEFKNERSQYWFLIGGGIALVGVVIGMILPRLQSSTRNKTW
jgi:SH3 domain protein